MIFKGVLEGDTIIEIFNSIALEDTPVAVIDDLTLTAQLLQGSHQGIGLQCGTVILSIMEGDDPGFSCQVVLLGRFIMGRVMIWTRVVGFIA